MSEHSLFPPSGMTRLIACPASWKEEQSRPEEPQSEYATHGIMLHSFVPRGYKTGKSVVQELPSKPDRSYVLDCIEYIQMLVATCNGLHEIQFEVRVNLDRFDVAEVWGTADVVLTDHYNKVVHVIDWKFGSGVPVFVDHNEQLMTYAAGTISDTTKDYNYTIHLVQPPLDYFGQWETTAEYLADFVHGSIKPAIQEAQCGKPTYGPSEKGCRFCSARFDCVARYDKTIEQAREVFKMHKQLPKVTPEQIADLFKIIPELKSALSDITKHVHNQLQSGRPIPGFKLVHGRNSRNWIDEKKVVQYLLNETTLTAEDIYKYELKSPAGIEKEDSTLKKDKVFQALYETVPGNPKVVAEADKRDSIVPEVEARKAFAVITGNNSSLT